MGAHCVHACIVGEGLVVGTSTMQGPLAAMRMGELPGKLCNSPHSHCSLLPAELPGAS